MNPNDDNAPGGDILTQSEVERLLSHIQAEESTLQVRRPDGTLARIKQEEIQPCDFRQPAFLTPAELRKIRLRHEDFIRSLAARLSIYLRLEVNIQMSKLQTVLYQKFTESLASPTQLTLFKAEPQRGICLLDVPPRLGLTMVDRLLGGPAHSVNANRDLSEIEIALQDQVTQVLLGEWCNLWQKIQELRPVIVGHENNARFLQTAAHDTVMLCLSMEVRLGDCIEQVQLAFPYYTVENLVRQLASPGEPEKPGMMPAGTVPRWNSMLDDVLVELSAQWRNLQMTAGELASLKPGDVVMLDAGCAEGLCLQIERIPKFRCRLGTCDDKWAVELIKPEKIEIL